jgi:serum/glucocorticoid-regulated kinase 2
MGNKIAKAQKSAEAAGGKTPSGAGASAAASASPAAVDTKISITDFEMISVLGRGAFGKVTLVKKKGDVTNTLYALKSLKKADLVRAHQVEHTATERYVLEQVHSPFLIHLSFAFQTTEKLYIVMDYLTGGEMFFWLKKQVKFSESRSKLYMAECVLAIEAMHAKDIVHRDLKPENILLDKDGHIKLVDYGLAKGGITSSGDANDGGVRTRTFCGTPEYVAPELIENQPHGKAVDWWALGAILYEMLYGLPPFWDNNTTTMYKKILHDEIKFKAEVVTSQMAKIIIRKMLERPVARRLGSRGSTEIKQEPFFASLEFKKVLSKKYTPEFIPPKQKNDSDVKNFDKEFTDEKPVESFATTAMSDTMMEKTQFEGFTYQDRK